jgi:hypothetical protein
MGVIAVQRRAARVGFRPHDGVDSGAVGNQPPDELA